MLRNFNRISKAGVSRVAGAAASPISRASPSLSRPHSTDPSNKPQNQTHFGFQSVDEDRKEGLVGSVFSSVAPAYDIMNDVMSLGIHRLWKDDFVKSLNPRSTKTAAEAGVSEEYARKFGGTGLTCIDMAGGTGDIAHRILDHAKDVHADRSVKVTVMDVNADMLSEGEKRARKSFYFNTDQIDFKLANAESLSDVESNSVDLYTMAFGIRNCTHIDRVIAEAYRVLKPGGVFAVLEFGKVSQPLLANAYSTYSFNVIPAMGHLVAGDRESYQYLVESIERFPDQATFAQMMRDAGFLVPNKRGYRDLTFGVASIWKGVKPVTAAS
ncbi:hypothetical protein E3P99_01574 [Wallemia hederae]|uniref:2-methoxy-6-polyprenyl-1,4-benzoquinol methylase, mitochondrial n=1 Tax=Wallemia hederae TaxID=1540922 RepID=A0A4V4LTI4_9BASI|nr:hypothetical protein E3P99_01574 [Wallemia hederae]